MALVQNIVERCPKCGRIKMSPNKTQESMELRNPERVQVEAPIKKKRLPDKVVTALWYVGYWCVVSGGMYALFSSRFSSIEFGPIACFAAASLAFPAIIVGNYGEDYHSMRLMTFIGSFMLMAMSLLGMPVVWYFNHFGDCAPSVENSMIGGAMASIICFPIVFEVVRCAKKRDNKTYYARPIYLLMCFIASYAMPHTFHWLMDDMFCAHCNDGDLLYWIGLLGLIAAPIFYLVVLSCGACMLKRGSED